MMIEGNNAPRLPSEFGVGIPRSRAIVALWDRSFITLRCANSTSYTSLVPRVSQKALYLSECFFRILPNPQMKFLWLQSNQLALACCMHPIHSACKTLKLRYFSVLTRDSYILHSDGLFVLVLGPCVVIHVLCFVGVKWLWLTVSLHFLLFFSCRDQTCQTYRESFDACCCLVHVGVLDFDEKWRRGLWARKAVESRSISFFL
ncbi:hypothetical protein M413DRAFT_271076 [Hebeloma cylindrosporum]|uniref:Uncharacterized protein n=1 Tax=Hebeloma cylindrosporum TaxID=76867 RepID=A0A0C3CSZ8_HEBCY|nr:hypothetical protein M413DRAFT_271076 [Hebeloma cylindrosporum h7]